MTVFRGSRYEGVEFTAIRGANGLVKKFLHNRKPVTVEDVGEDFFVRTIQREDQFDDIAFEFGGKSRLWWVIADVNEEFFPFDPKIGKS